MLSTAALLVVGCTAPAGPDAGADAGADAGPDAGVAEAFTFAILTDIHVGEGFAAHGTAGWDDDGGEPNHITERVRAAIAAVNAEAADIRFVLVLGDLTDSGERSEFERARALLDELTPPWIPLLGNHDVWPYVRTADGGFQEGEAPVGDAWLREVFADRFAALPDELDEVTPLPEPVTAPVLGGERRFVNLAFSWADTRCLCLDLNTRVNVGPAHPGISGAADLHDFPGGTWPWLRDELERADERHVLVFSHHPPLPLGLDSMSVAEQRALAELLETTTAGPRVRAFFAGHWHFDQVFEDVYPGAPVVVTDAAKESSAVRLVRVGPSGPRPARGGEW